MPVRPTDPTTPSEKIDLPEKCTQCSVFDIEQNAGFPALLAESAQLKIRLEELRGATQAEQRWERYDVEMALADVYIKIEDVEAEANRFIEAAQFYGYF